MKTREELNTLREECRVLATRLSELSEDELKEVVGGGDILAGKNPGTNIDFYITLAKDFGNAVNSHDQDSMNW